MAQQRRVIFLNRFFYPDHAPTAELLSDVAFALAERDFDVSVITSRQNYDKADAELPRRENVRGVDIAECGRQSRADRSSLVAVLTT